MKTNVIKYISVALTMLCAVNAQAFWDSKGNRNTLPKRSMHIVNRVEVSPKKTAVYSKNIGSKPKGLQKARLTVYWANGSGTDRWSRKRESASGVRLSNGHCAVDPRCIPFGSTVEIYVEDNRGEYKLIDRMKAVDTGTKVKLKTASGGRHPVIDKFFVDKSDARSYDNRTPDYVLIRVL